MRKTTIFRFSGSEIMVAAALFVAAAPVAAQDSLVLVQPDSLLLVQADSVRPDSLLSQQQSSVHIVQEGETLWTLADYYLGDPLLWPEIYRFNTMVVEDPHWIFPGEALRLSGADSVLIPRTVLAMDSLAPPDTQPDDAVELRDPGDIGDSQESQERAVDLPPDESELLDLTDPEIRDEQTVRGPPPPSGPLVFRQRGSAAGAGVTVISEPLPRATGRMIFYSAGFLTEGEDLAWGEVRGAVDKPILSTLPSSSSARIFDVVDIRAPSNATYHIGDSLVLARVSRIIPDWGRIVVPTGVAQVIAVEGRNVRALIEMQFERVADGQVAMPVGPFRDRDKLVAVPIEGGLRGSIITVRDRHPVPNLRDVVFIDRGRADGLVPGDVFEILATDGAAEFEAMGERQVAILEIVHVRERSASAVLVRIFDLGAAPGASVRLIGKMPA